MCPQQPGICQFLTTRQSPNLQVTDLRILFGGLKKEDSAVKESLTNFLIQD